MADTSRTASLFHQRTTTTTIISVRAAAGNRQQGQVIAAGRPATGSLRPIKLLIDRVASTTRTSLLDLSRTLHPRSHWLTSKQQCFCHRDRAHAIVGNLALVLLTTCDVVLVLLLKHVPFCSIDLWHDEAPVQPVYFSCLRLGCLVRGC